MHHEERSATPTAFSDGSDVPSSLADPAASATRGQPTSSSLLRFVLFALGLLAIFPWLTGQIGAFTHGQGVYDFSVYYAAALALRDNAHANIYDPAVLQRAAALHGAYLMPVATLYLYPPLLAIALIPLTVVSFNVAAYIWAACNLAFWLVVTGLLVSLFADLLGCGAEVRAFGRWLRSVPPISGSGSGDARIPRLSDTALFAFALPIILSLTSATIEESVVIGQVSLFVLLLLVLALWLEQHGKPGTAGAVLAVAALIKVFPGLFLLYYVLRGKWRAAAGFVAGVVGLLVGMALYVGIDGVLATRYVFINGTSSGEQYQNEALARVPFWLSVVVNHRLSERSASLLGYVLIALVLAAFVAGLVWTARDLWHRGVMARVRDSGEIACAGFAWTLCTMVLISPVTWEHHLAWLFPAFIMAVGLSLPSLYRPGWHAQRGWITPAVVLAVAVIGYVFVARDLPFGYDGRVPFDPSPNLLGKIPVRPFFMIQRPVGGVLLWCATGYLFLRLSGRVAADLATAKEDAIQTVAAEAAGEEVDVQA